MPHTHITIIGGGIVGLALAGLLANTGRHITLIDHGHPPTAGLKIPYDLRVAAINHASECIFKSLGVWDAITALRVSAYQKMHVWDENSPARIGFDCADVGRNHLGHIIEYSVIRQVLYQYLAGHKNIHLCYETKPIALQEIQDGMVLTLENGEYLHTKLLVGADGGNSWVAQEAGLITRSKPYQHSALVTTLKTEKSHKHTAWQRFLTQGPLAFLPLAGTHQISVVWSTASEHTSHLATLPEIDFNETIARAFEYQLGEVSVQDQRIVFPLTEHRAIEYTRSRIALIGDAAHTIHPLAGQGMNLGLLDAAALAQVLMDAQDPGKLAILRRYERWRKGDNELMLKAMSGFKQLFGSTSALHIHARSLGFLLTDKLPFVKNYFIERAMGLSGDLPMCAKEPEFS
ncbi:MAG: Ubiquinone biosynthesis hydroxylase, UbiH/UbiF/VisC/COQ6 family [Gammaproteobacteria bacterium]|jgi:2-octaprenylphenol hydroxylase|nr:Ubiquinone biosynthesis hydroxylase, UbiH/UbiF/VisC/COQ6 family [Gammaproteobacteria bacterium]